MGTSAPQFGYFKDKETKMVSLAEKMAANLDMSAFGKAEELKKKIMVHCFGFDRFPAGNFYPAAGN